MKQDTSLQQQTDGLRDHGSKAFHKDEFEKARDLYTQSLEGFEDHHAICNRALFNLEIGKAMIEPSRYSSKIVLWGEESMADAGQSLQDGTDIPKAYYRMALGHVMARYFPRAKMDVKDGLKKCPDNAGLLKLLDELENLGVLDYISNPFSDAAREASSKITDGGPFGVCTFCRQGPASNGWSLSVLRQGS
jgi:hypothetical protein